MRMDSDLHVVFKEDEDLDSSDSSYDSLVLEDTTDDEDSSGPSYNFFPTENEELINEADKFEILISANKYSYDAHIKVINIYGKLADLNTKREAYKRFQECFPLPPKLWLEWIQDEIKIANTEDEKRRILELFEKAVKDYFSVELWFEYSQYSIGICNIRETCNILKKGLKSVGLHVGEGSLIWDTLRNLEIDQISYYPKGSKHWREQIKRVAEIFENQLSIPLTNMENTYLQWTEWCKTIPENYVDPKPIVCAYKIALINLQLYKPFEDKLSSAKEEDLYDIYREYIKMVKDPLMVISLYERAIVNLHLNPIVWEDYITFSLNMEEVALAVSEKALRIFPSSEKFWIWRLRVLEHCKIDDEEYVLCFKKVLSDTRVISQLDLWLHYLGYNRRNFSDCVVEKIYLQALQHITREDDPEFELQRWYARFEAKRGNVPMAKKIWTKTILADPRMMASVDAWLEFARFQRRYGLPGAARFGFKKALNCCRAWTPIIGEEWLSFERETGSVLDVIQCEEKCKSVMTNLMGS